MKKLLHQNPEDGIKKLKENWKKLRLELLILLMIV